jgi:hypothetical protein
VSAGVECLPTGNGVTTECEESPLSEVVARERLVKTAGWKRFNGCCCE